MQTHSFQLISIKKLMYKQKKNLIFDILSEECSLNLVKCIECTATASGSNQLKLVVERRIFEGA